MKKIHKFLSVLICIALIISTFSYTRAYAATNPLSYPELPQDEVDRIIAQLAADGIRLTNMHGDYLNAGVYKLYGVAVYGFPHEHDTGRDKKWVNGRYEYRHLGYDYFGNCITNDRFPPDFPPDSAPLPDRIWQVVDRDLISWDSKVAHNDQENRILNYSPIRNEGIPYNYSLAQVVQKQAGSDITNQRRHMLVQVAPGLISDGSVRLTRKASDGTIRYMTFIIDRFNYGTPTCIIDASDAVIEGDREYVDIPVTVKGDFTSMNLPMGKAASDIINEVNLTFEGTSRAATASNPAATFTKRVYKKDLNIGNNSVTLEGILEAGSVYRLQGDRCEYQGIRATKTINVEVKPVNAYVDITVTATPEEKQVDGSSDEKVTVKVTAQLKNYSNRSNIKSWRIFAKIENEESTLQQITLPGGTLTATASFTFTVKKSKLSSIEFTELFKATAFADFNNKVDGNTYLNNSDYCRTYFYKSPPPPPPPPEPENIPPVAVISAPTVVTAGEYINISGRNSYDPDGIIEGYEWHIPGSIGDIEGVSGSVIFPNPGNYTITLYVVDDKGATGNVSKNIRVIEPYPSARIAYSGILKENRKINLDASGSHSTYLYPVNHNLTTWTITPLSGGTAQDIKYEGLLTGAPKKEVLFKKSGEYLITLTVTNARGLSDTTQLIINIGPDEAPIADFSTVTAITRDVNDSLQATIKLTDKSYSPDGDILAGRRWRYAFDSNNDGNFDDETWKIFSSGNSRNVELKVNSVGKYKIELEVKEEFIGATIPAFITSEDNKTGDTSLKPDIEKIVEVVNLPPEVDYIMTEKKKVDLTISVGNTAHNDMGVIESKINSIIKPALSAKGVDLNVNILPVDGQGKNLFWYVGHRQYYVYDEDYDESYLVNRYRLAAYDPNMGEHIIVVDDQSSQIRAQVFPNGKVYYRVGWGNIMEHDPVTKTTTTFLEASGKVYDDFLISDDMKWVYSNRSFSYEWFGNIFTGDDFFIYETTTGQVREKRYHYTDIGEPYQLTEGKIIFNYKPYEEVFVRGSIYNPITDIFQESISVNPANGIVNKNGYAYYIGWLYDRLHKIRLTGGSESTVSWDPVDSLVDGRKENLIFYNKQSGNGAGFIKYVDGVGEETILDEQVIIYATTFDNKVYYSKKSNTRQLYVYDIDRNSQEYVGELPQPNFKIMPERVFYSQDMEQSVSDYSIYERLTDSDWRERGDRYFIHIDDEEISELKDDKASASIQSILLSKNVHFVGMGAETNREQISKLINQNEGRGIYIDNSNIDTAFLELKNYIIENSAVNNEIYRYVTVGTELQIDTFYSDPENDLFYEGRWSYFHDPNYFENSMGIIPDSGIYRTEPITVFDKVGKYEVVYQAKDNPKDDMNFDNYRLWSRHDKKLTLFVHRKPIAQFNYKMEYNSSLNNYSVEISDTSYDLDHMSRSDRGIVVRIWQYKEADDEGWTEGMPPSVLPADKVYMVKLQVRDMEFEWSDPCIRIMYTKETELPPVAQFVLWPDPLPIYMLANINDNSYDPAGYPIIQRTWTLLKEQTQESYSELYSGSTAPLNYSLYGTGDYTLKLQVRNSKGLWSEEYSQSFRVVDDEFPPTLTIDPVERDWENTNVRVYIKSSDEGSGLKHINYRWTNSKESPENISWNLSTGNNIIVTQSQNGIWYLHVESYDKRNNKIYLVGGPYKVDKTPPVVNVSPESGELSDSDEVYVTAYDEGGSGIKEVRYCWSESGVMPLYGWEVTSSTTFYTAPFNDGNWYLHIQAFDNAGNNYYKCAGPYNIGSLDITDVTIEGYWNHWRGQINIFGKRMSVEPHRFLSLERVKINIFTTGYADKVEIRFSPELEAMEFRDKYGNLYDYKKDFKLDYVSFPAVFELDNTIKDNHVYWEYALPLAESTKSWDDAMLREPYFMEVTVWKGSEWVRYIISDIEITGNIYDLTYIQPIN